MQGGCKGVPVQFVSNKRPFCGGIQDGKTNAPANLQPHLRAKYCSNQIISNEISGQLAICNIYQSVPRGVILNLLNRAQNLTPHFSDEHFRTIVPSTIRSSRWSLYLKHVHVNILDVFATRFKNFTRNQ
jgi:hypothetical protein